ncbi:hypothetical protein POM88_037164 [Heracleum sosnowskyi]|uniref:Uncharacterized protein n=1 Tax=Heracleum sosnowskyi TaxID=360622 RepID=A0AAD8MFL6_9APIA|nr:hypothetical protein POM88_037164 [Heracleum sosnowskyi]
MVRQNGCLNFVLKCELVVHTVSYQKGTALFQSLVNSSTQKESDAQLEIAKLKSELHREKSKTDVAESTEERTKREKLTLELANQNLALKVEEATCELQILKDIAYKGTEEKQNSDVIETDDATTEEQKDACITISVREFESLVPDKTSQTKI